MPFRGLQIGDQVYKIRGYRFRGTIRALGVKSDGFEFCVVEVEPGPNADGLLYIHHPNVLEKIEHEKA